MPWTPADAHRHKRGLSARQARQWARVANSALRRCLADGGTQSRCEASAIRQANSAVGDPELSTERRLTIQTALTVPPARLTLQNRDYLTAPAVLIVQGVLNSGYIDASELHPTDWNHVPIVVNHPLDGAGQPMSARTPEVLATSGVGYLYHARLGTGQRSGHQVASLQAELWLDVAQVQALGGEAAQAMTMLEAQTPLELSTGFYSQAEPTPGTFHGVPYEEVHHDIRPDHLALLPNGIGACDWQSGCGSPRLNQQCTCHQETPMEHHPARGWRGFVHTLNTFVQQAEAELPSTAPAVFINGYYVGDGANAEVCTLARQLPTPPLRTHLTDADIREALYGALAREMGVDLTPIFIDAVDSEQQTFTYRQGERLLQRSWSETDGQIALTEGSQDVQRHTTYVPVTHAREEVPMPSEAVRARVTALITDSATPWQEADRPQLEAMSEAQLERFAPNAAEQARLQEYEARKQHVITALVANTWCRLSESTLKSMTLQELEDLTVMGAEQDASYAGQGFPAARQQADSDDAWRPLSILTKKEEARG